MAGNMRVELPLSNHESSLVGNYQNGQRGYSAPTLGRSASFRESAESRMLNSVKANSRGSVTSSEDVPTLSQYLMLGPLFMGDQRHARPSELRRVLSFCMGNASEDNSVTSSHPKTSPSRAVDELKRFRASVADTCFKASGRARKLDEHLNKLNSFFEATSSKRQQLNELLANERSSSLILKIGSQMHRNPPEVVSQKFDDWPKNDGLSKRLRTSVADNRAVSRNNAMVRQPLPMTKERDPSKDKTESDVTEEKIKRLPAGGEGWDKKMKRKRSIGAIFSRLVDNDVELKRTVQHKLSSESIMHSNYSTHGFRSGVSGVSNQLDSTLSPAVSNIQTTSKNEQEMSMLSKDLSTGPLKERALGKANVKLNNREENTCPSPLVKGKASRAPRSGSMVATNSGANIPRVSGTLEIWEQPPVVSRTPSIGAVNNASPITQWGGQRLNKIARTRRIDLIPVSNHDEVQIQSEGGSPLDFGPRINTVNRANASLLFKSSANGNKNLRVIFENVPSPARLSEIEESGAGENITEKGVGSGDLEESDTHTGNIGFPVIPMKKNKIMSKEEIGDGVRRLGSNGRVLPFSRVIISPKSDKLDIVVPMKPVQNARSGSDKNRSKSGRPLKKLSARKGISRVGHMANGGSPDCSGESEDDREELLEAANLAWNFSRNACSSASWKTVEAFFASVGLDEKSYLLEQLKSAEESCAISSQDCSHGNNIQDGYGCEEAAVSDSTSHRRNGHVINKTGYKDSLGAVKNCDISTPVFHRLLSALIVEDDIEVSEKIGFGRRMSSINDSRLLTESESKHMDMMDFCQPIFSAQAQNNRNGHIIFSCNGNTNFNRSRSAQDHPCNGELHQRNVGYVHSDVEVSVRLSRCDYVPRRLQTNNCRISAFDYQYERISLEEKLIVELQSIDLFVETVPALDDKEHGVNQEIAQLEKRLHQQIWKKKKELLDKLYKTLEDGNNVKRRDPEQVAMDKLVELAFKKLLPTKGSLASKHRMAKVSKPAAFAFMKRTLVRCRKFEDSRTSCFSEAPLRDIVYAAPYRFDEKELLAGTNLAVPNEIFENQAFAKNGPISSRGRKRELLLDNVGGAVFQASSALAISGGSNGKRSERDTSTKSAKVGRPIGGSKTKSKPKQWTAQLSTSANGCVNKFTDTTGSSGNTRKDVECMPSCNALPVSMKEEENSMDLVNLPLNDVEDIVEELGVDSETGAPQDLNSWFNFEVDGLQDHDSVGLEIPMDDLSELQMF